MLKAKLAMDQTQNPSLCLLLLQPTQARKLLYEHKI